MELKANRRGLPIGFHPGQTPAQGDPNLATLDGTSFDLQSVGEFDLVQSARDDIPYDFSVQSRFAASGTRVSLIGAVAFRLNGHIVELGGPDVLVDHQAFPVADGGYVYFGNGSALLRNGSKYVAVWPGSSLRPVLTYSPLSLRIYVPPQMATRGLLGNNNGLRTDDFVDRSGASFGLFSYCPPQPQQCPDQLRLDHTWCVEW